MKLFPEKLGTLLVTLMGCVLLSYVFLNAVQESLTTESLFEAPPIARRKHDCEPIEPASGEKRFVIKWALPGSGGML